VLTRDARRQRWTKTAELVGRGNICAVPFDAVELDLGALWI
jgi:hypothetical protein